MPKPLNELERRVSGVLLEKLLATPAYYPMTANALTAGCNQKSNRDPVLDLSEEAVDRTLEALLEKGLAVVVRAEGARTVKWKTIARDAFALSSEKAMALFAELLLRGPQTKAELRAHASRMRHELAAEDVEQVLDEMAKRPEPLVVNLGRAPGGRAERWAHTLYSEQEMAALRAGPVEAAPAASTSGANPEKGGEGGVGAGLAARLQEALREIAALEARVSRLEGAVGLAPEGGAGAPQPRPHAEGTPAT